MKYSNKNNEFRMKIFRSDSEDLVLIESIKDGRCQVIEMTPWQAKYIARSILDEVDRIEENNKNELV